MRTVAASAFVVLMFFGVACSCFEEANPQPTEDVVTLVNESVAQWLFLQITEDSWALFSDEDAGWRNASTLAALEQWFSEDLAQALEEEGLWDFELVVQDIKDSGLYADDPLADEVLLELIQRVLSAFRLEPLEGE